MELGIFAKTFSGTTPESVLRQTSETGFAVVQYNMACSGLPSMPDAISAEAVDAVSAASHKEGVRLVAVSGTYNMAHPDQAVRAKGLKRLETLAASCAGLGTNLITLCTGTRDADDQWCFHPDNNTEPAWHDLLAEMEKAIRIADTHNVYLGIEPELANVVNSAAKARRMIDSLGSDRVKIVLDPANLFEVEPIVTQRSIVAEAIDLLGDRIVMGHAKDRTASGDFVAAGTGVLDYPHYIKAMNGIRFSGPLITHGLSAAEAPGVAAFLKGVLRENGVELAS
jgi:sugar phosphate isomerase/epimerase